MKHHDSGPTRPRNAVYLWLGALTFATVAGFFLWGEHRVHLLGNWPWLLLLACPLLHFGMHGGHAHHRERPEGDDPGDRPS
ncbi:MAG: DUF2933 domain-containing protein [Acidobacteria bacterium]|nr:MAG: DUF2933 domain-containing protein [Acidobacteriota bacterium]REK04456.1 MAG: DUF2933 domain-containing protein [Acidobacteriota bacterium]